MLFDFTGKNVVVTGACGDIGLALCRVYLDAGARVYALDIDREKLKRVAELVGADEGQENRLFGLYADITQRESVQSALSVIPVDILIANAGMATAASLKSAQPEQWHKDIDLNINGTYHCVEAALPNMKDKGEGSIVIIGSVNGFQAIGYPAYSAAKAALESYTKALAMEYGVYGIRANIVCPGTVKTQAWQQRCDKDPEVFERLTQWYPLKNFPDPEDIANATAFLSSSLARTITGVALPVDGGLSAGNRLLASQLTLEEF